MLFYNYGIKYLQGSKLKSRKQGILEEILLPASPHIQFPPALYFSGDPYLGVDCDTLFALISSQN